MVASSLAYTTILSIIPLLAVSFSIFQAFGGMENLYKTIEPLIIENLAQGTGEDTMETIRGFISKIHAGALGASGLVGLILTSMSMLSSAEKAINRVWNTPITRSLFSRVASYWLFITLGPIGVAFAVGIATSSKIPMHQIFPSGAGSFAGMSVLFFGIYKWVPCRHVSLKAAAISGLLISGLWSLARMGYTIYNKHVLTYNKIYGSLAAFPILLFWIYIMWVIVLTGVAFSFSLQKQIEKI